MANTRDESTINVDTGSVTIYNHKSDVYLDLSTSICFASTTLQDVALRQHLTILVSDAENATLYIDRPHQLHLAFVITMQDQTSCDIDGLCTDLSFILSGADVCKAARLEVELTFQ